MRSFGMLAAGAVSTLMAATLVAGAAQAQAAGAPIGTQTQSGSWGQGGWQAGAPGATVEPQPAYAPQQAYVAQPGYVIQPGYGGQPAWHSSPRGDFHRARPGSKMPKAYLDPMYAVSDWQAWGLAQPGPGMHWLRYYNDAVLVDNRGRVVDTRFDFGWNRPRGGYADGAGYAAGPGYPPPGYGAPAYAPGTTTYRAGPNTTVTTSVVAAPPPVVAAAPAPAYGYGYGYGGGYYAGGASVVSVTPGVVVTTTTTTTSYDTVYKSVGVKRAYKRRAYRPSRPRCVRAPTCPVLGS